MVTEITSKDNKNLKLIRGLEKKSIRDKNNKYTAEGKRLVDEAIRYAMPHIFCVVMSKEFSEKNEEMVKTLDKSEKNVYIVTESIFSKLSFTENSQGVLAVIEMPKPRVYDNADFILVLDGVSEPGNMGTIIRTAEAAGIDAIYTTAGSVDIYNPKTVRSTMGSIFRMNIIQGVSKQEIINLKKEGYYIAATALSNSEEIKSFKKPEKLAIIIGSEAHGVSEELLDISDKRIRIPMQGKVESLNAAVAAGIVMYSFGG